jgi:hypothetical protein
VIAIAIDLVAGCFTDVALSEEDFPGELREELEEFEVVGLSVEIEDINRSTGSTRPS